MSHSVKHDTHNKDNHATHNHDDVEDFQDVENPLTEMEDEFIGIEYFDEHPDIEEHRVEALTFAEWNRKQEPENRILYPVEFTRTTPKLKFSAPEEGTYPKDDGTVGSYVMTKMKEDRGGGKERSVLVSSPALISPSGYKLRKTKMGEILSIDFIMDMSNPHHRHFSLVTLGGMVRQFIEDVVMTGPGKWGIEATKIENPGAAKNGTEKEKAKYKSLYRDAEKSISKFMAPPKLGDEEFDMGSNIRMGFINPLEYIDKKDPKKTSHMKVFLPGNKDPVSKEVLLRICEGWYFDEESGEEKQEKAKGFEFSFSWLMSRVTKTGKNSFTPRGQALFIHRFFDAKEFDTQATKHAIEISHRVVEDFSRYVGVTGFKDEKKEETAVVVKKSGFAPMAAKPALVDEASAPRRDSSPVREPKEKLPSKQALTPPPTETVEEDDTEEAFEEPAEEPQRVAPKRQTVAPPADEEESTAEAPAGVSSVKKTLAFKPGGSRFGLGRK